MRVLVTRPQREAETIARRLAAAGHEAVVAPVLRIEATDDIVPDAPFEAVLATSAHAIERLRESDAQRLQALPLYVVGARAADLAKTRGFAEIAMSAPDASHLAEAIATVSRPPTRWLYLAGRDRKPDLERRLAALGHDVSAAVVYEARTVEDFPEAAATALRAGALDAALHFSRRSADVVIALAQAAGVAEAFAALAHVCISADAAAPLRALAARVVVSSPPTSQAMIAALDPMHARRASGIGP